MKAQNGRTGTTTDFFFLVSIRTGTPLHHQNLGGRRTGSDPLQQKRPKGTSTGDLQHEQ